MRLAAEWQGFLRQVHDEITERFRRPVRISWSPAQITHNLITYRREIDIGNANADATATHPAPRSVTTEETRGDRLPR